MKRCVGYILKNYTWKFTKTLEIWKIMEFCHCVKVETLHTCLTSCSLVFIILFGIYRCSIIFCGVQFMRYFA